MPHTAIFLNRSHLPVFSSAAIETHLHRISGLSRYFIYFNDDVFLGAPVLPEDFMSTAGVQRFYTAWEVPRCALGCSESWIGDGYCDTACNVRECDFDYPDCVNVTSTSQQTVGLRRRQGPDAQCKPGCPDSWLADKVCDMRCKYEECGWDLGDCGTEGILHSFSGHNLTLADVTWNNVLDSDSNSNSNNSSSMEPQQLLPISSSFNGSIYPVVLQIPINITACYLNLTGVFLDEAVWNYFASRAPVANITKSSDADVLDGITYQPMRPVLSDQLHVRSCVIVPKEHILVVLFDTQYSSIAGNNSVNNLPLSYDLTISVAGTYSHFGVPFNITFSIRIQGDNVRNEPYIDISNNTTDSNSPEYVAIDSLVTNNSTSTHMSDRRRLMELRDSDFKWTNGVEEYTFRMMVPLIFAEYYYYYCRLTTEVFRDKFTTSIRSHGKHTRRRLSENAYRDSLVFVNRLYTRFYGKDARKVPAHMPHMIDRNAMEELQSMWPAQWNATSQHRFRSGKDMQYAFAYFHHLVNRHKGRPPVFQTRQVFQLLHDLVDADHDSSINRNEFHTLAAMVSGRSPTLVDMHSLLTNCTNITFTFETNSTVTQTLLDIIDIMNGTEAEVMSRNFTNVTINEEKKEEESNERPEDVLAPIYSIPESLQVPIRNFAECTTVKDGIFKYFDWSEYMPTHVISNGDKSVSFEMITDNATHTRMQLDSVRQKHLKFVCVNDNLEQPSPALEQLLHDFYLSYFPQPSLFELPDGVTNPSLYLDECLRHHDDESNVYVLGLFSIPFSEVTTTVFVAAIALLLMMIIISSWFVLFLFKLRKRASSVKKS